MKRRNSLVDNRREVEKQGSIADNRRKMKRRNSLVDNRREVEKQGSIADNRETPVQCRYTLAPNHKTSCNDHMHHYPLDEIT